ncbi:tetratricopeptide repeat protein [Streptomyces sp. BH-SS-21]|uniref:Tetratricopeptide repeat protein n=1 Tax=Streptomyces liliiviolaceus TaxID=2823109 RepID=A0A940Y2N9_9ACTN|nr:BTAD domain-containing putative transcriptional regulator [Streptomyces liliiviolaceus]MBQ0851856.1 tetratricopeptide repeat protein [Streptomyces liliiviolaceus]
MTVRPGPASAGENTLRLSILGPLRAWHRGTELHLGPPKQRSVLALLLVRAGRPVPVHHLVDSLWDGDPPERAVNVVHRHVGALRRLLEPGLTQRSEARVLVRAAGGYRLDVGEEALDLHRFRTLRDAGQEAADHDRPGEAADLLLAALALRSGPTAATLPPGLRSHTDFAAVDAEYFRAAQAAAETALVSRRTQQALPLLGQAAQEDSLNEVLQAGFIRVLAAEGLTARALEQYRRVRGRLADELGVDPGPELRAAQADVLRGTVSPTADTPPRTSAATAATTAPTASAPPASPASEGRSPALVRPAQLPAALRVFSGRRTEIERLDSLLPAGTRTSVAIGGAPGVGKTTLALHWAHRAAHRFPDGQLYLDLRGYDPSGDPLTPSTAICHFLESLGIPSERVPAGLDSRTALYRSVLAGRRCLIVLDNARNAEQVRPLLPGGPGCFTVVTSREQLTGLVASAGTSLLTVDVLTVAEAVDFLTRRLGRPRVERSREAALAIIEHCGRLPLTLAVVCARAESRPGTPLAEVAAELERSRDSLQAFTLSGTSDPVTDTRSVFSWSYRALTGQAADAFRRLWLSPSPDVSPQAAASLTGLPMEKTRQVMSELHRANLWIEYGSGRYGTHELLKRFGQEMSRAEDTTASVEGARQRLYDHYLHSAHHASSAVNTHREHPTLPPPAPGTQVMTFTGTAGTADWLHHEMPALHAIAVRDTYHGEGVRPWRLAAVLELILDRSGRRQEQTEIQSAALLAAQRAGDAQGQAQMHRSLGFALGRTQQGDQAARHLEQALVLFAEAGDLLGEALTHRYLAFLRNAMEAHEQALTHYEAALALYRTARHELGIASVTNEVGWTRILLRDFEGAVEYCQRAVDIARRVGNRNVEAASWDSLGVAHHRLGREPEALRALHRALEHYRRLGDAYLTADTLVHIGNVHRSASPGKARQAWTEALDILDSLGHPEGELIRERLKDIDGGSR